MAEWISDAGYLLLAVRLQELVCLTCGKYYLAPFAILDATHRCDDALDVDDDEEAPING